MINLYIFKEVTVQYGDFQKALGENLSYTIVSVSFI